MEEMSVSLLQKNIKWLSYNKKFHICIHDASGILHSYQDLMIKVENRIHNCSFCNIAKTTAAGMRYCLKCKALSIRKSMKEKSLFLGRCYLGITEIVKPVFYEGKLVCIIYLGNLLEGDRKGQCIKKIGDACSITGVKSDNLIDALMETEAVSEDELQEYKEITEILEAHILLVLSSKTSFKSKKESTYPIYSSTDNWIIEAVQNYASTYYNRELKLTELAKIYFLNPQYLCRLFKRKTGTHFTDYLNRIRIEKAKEMLKLSEDTVLDIALRVGFNNVTYFNRVFKVIEGVTPTEYRKL
jgi:AraC-like DNA-binding protein/ligand-binding sensor protein